jgi:RNA polymerase sigma-70 factor, ECF subfamily
VVVGALEVAARDACVPVDVFASQAVFDAWYEQAVPRVFAYVLARCGRDHDVAEDLTQQAFVEAVRCRASFDHRSDPITWVCGIARHRLADHYRRLDAEERRNLRLVEADPEDPLREDPAGVVEREAIAAALATLPPLQRAVLVFTALDGLTVREAARLLERSESATESLLHRARVAFRLAYDGEGGRGHG